MQIDYKVDFYRFYGRYTRSFKEWLGRPLQLDYIYWLRKTQRSKGIFRIYYRYRLNKCGKKTHIEISPQVSIGEGFCIMHAGGVIMFSDVKIGNYVNINSGAVIGAEVRGKRQGCPTIGDYCYIGKNAAIVGRIKIGDDVLIAPNAYVNFDVPSHSIVLGNPGKIIPRQNATKGYIYNIPEVK